MAKLVWNAAGSRFFEAGVDQGVLFAPNSIGVAWSGLTSVKEAPSGADPQAYYLDGIKYLQVSSGEEFNATIEAFSAPPEFDVCDGTANLFQGLYITQQPRKQFNFCYRTLIGNDAYGQDYGYKLHLVWNALAKPTGRDNVSIADSNDPMALSWDITTVPPTMTGVKPTAHMVVNAVTATPTHLSMLESIIYGTDFVDPRMPSAAEVMDIFSHSPMSAVDNGDGTFGATGSNNDVSNPTVDTFQIYHPAVVDNGDGTFTLTTGVTDG